MIAIQRVMEPILSRQIDLYDEFIRIESASLLLRNEPSDDNAKNLKSMLEPWLSSHISGGIQRIISRFFSKNGLFKIERPQSPLQMDFLSTNRDSAEC